MYYRLAAIIPALSLVVCANLALADDGEVMVFQNVQVLTMTAAINNDPAVLVKDFRKEEAPSCSTPKNTLLTVPSLSNCPQAASVARLISTFSPRISKAEAMASWNGLPTFAAHSHRINVNCSEG